MKRGKKFVALFAALALSFSMMTTVSFAAFADDDVIDEPAAFASDDIADEPAVDADTADNGQAAGDEAAGEEDSELGNEVDGEEEVVEEPVLAAAPAATPADEVVLAAEETELEPAAQTIKSISLTSTNPVCGTFVKCQGATMYWPPNYQPAPPISVDTPNCSIYGAWWVEGNGPDIAHVYPRNRDITVDGTKWYKFVLNLHPDEGYDFTSETAVTISTGSVLSSEFYPGDQWNASAIIAVFEIPATHDWGEWTVTKEPTTTAPGERVRVCKHDSTHTETGTIPPVDDTTPATDDSSDSTDGSGSTPAASDGSGSTGGPLDRSTGGSGTAVSQSVVPASSAAAGNVDNGLTTITNESNPTTSGVDSVSSSAQVSGVTTHAAIWIAIAAAAMIALLIVLFRRKKNSDDEE